MGVGRGVGVSEGAGVVGVAVGYAVVGARLPASEGAAVEGCGVGCAVVGEGVVGANEAVGAAVVG